MLSTHHTATRGEEGKKRKKVVIKKIIRKTKKTHLTCDAKPPDCQYSPPTHDNEELQNGTAVPNTGDSMDMYAEASCNLEALRLSQTKEPAQVADDDTLPATLPDAPSPVVEVADSPQESIEKKLESFMSEQFDDRLRLPEEETPPDHGDHGADGSGLADAHDATCAMLQKDQPDNGIADRADEAPPMPSPDAAEDHAEDDAWQTDKSWQHGYWSEKWNTSWDHTYHDEYWNRDGYWNGYGNQYGGDCMTGYGSYWGYGSYDGHGYYGSECNEGHLNTDELATPVRPVQRSRSIDSGFSELTSISAIHAKMNRLDTPDAVGKGEEHPAQSGVAEPKQVPDDESRVPIGDTPSSKTAERGDEGNQNHDREPAEKSKPAEGDALGEGDEPHTEAGQADENEDRTWAIHCILLLSCFVSCCWKQCLQWEPTLSLCNWSMIHVFQLALQALKK